MPTKYILLVDRNPWWRIRMSLAFRSAGYMSYVADSVDDVRAMTNASALFGGDDISKFEVILIGPKPAGTVHGLVAMNFALAGKKDVVQVSIHSNHPGLAKEAVQAALLNKKDETVRTQFSPLESDKFVIVLEKPGRVEAYHVRVVLWFWLWRQKFYKKDLPAGVSSFTVPDAWVKRIWPALLVVKVDGKTRFVQ
ncbi:MAG TPA: hypothetical protein PLC89_13995 [Haliscomenobacter sp.]|uniref:hypothetical protein n=1 Tax=Haliscomenobacter sp. TaxID=2717303 RepID=UPI002BF4E47C|nr:hypothetical protein [Haliscomenobacter sp.]HOY18413.1 hypothetical protein [Haliscomenobacter sp.]